MHPPPHSGPSVTLDAIRELLVQHTAELSARIAMLEESQASLLTQIGAMATLTGHRRLNHNPATERRNKCPMSYR